MITINLLGSRFVPPDKRAVRTLANWGQHKHVWVTVEAAGVHRTRCAVCGAWRHEQARANPAEKGTL